MSKGAGLLALADEVGRALKGASRPAYPAEYDPVEFAVAAGRARREAKAVLAARLKRRRLSQKARRWQ